MIWKKHQLNVIQKYYKYCTTLFVNKYQQVEILVWKSHSGKLVTSEKTWGEIVWLSEGFLSMNGAFFSWQHLSSSPAVICALFTFLSWFYSLISSSSSLSAPFLPPQGHLATLSPFAPSALVPLSQLLLDSKVEYISPGLFWKVRVWPELVIHTPSVSNREGVIPRALDSPSSERKIYPNSQIQGKCHLQQLQFYHL